MVPEKIQVCYTNWKGETRVRTILPIKLEFLATKYHPEKQWTILAVDPEDGKEKNFALKDCNFKIEA